MAEACIGQSVAPLPALIRRPEQVAWGLGWEVAALIPLSEQHFPLL